MQKTQRRTLITSPLEWQLTAAPVPAPSIPMLAERGDTQIKAPKAVLLIDTREKNPLEAGFKHIARTQPLRSALRKGAQSAVPLADRAIGNLQQWLIGTYHGVTVCVGACS